MKKKILMKKKMWKSASVSLWLFVILFSFGGCGVLESEKDGYEPLPMVKAIEPEEINNPQNIESESQSGEAEESLLWGSTESTEEEGYSFLDPRSGSFAYESLTDREKLWYADINRILSQMLEKQELSEEALQMGMDETHIDSVFQCVLNDHPEYFYVEGYTYTKYTRGEELVKIEFSGAYSMTLEDAILRQSKILASAEKILQGIDREAEEYEKVKYVYETLIRNTDYNLEAEDNQNIYSVFINQSSVCQGYAKATQFLLNQLGVECTLVMGTVDTGEGHAWNLVKVDGSYYYVDTTWGDASYQMSDSVSPDSRLKAPEINYDYLCVTTKQLLRTHIIGGSVPMPQCVSMEANYYMREGVYFTGYNEKELSEAFSNAFAGGEKDITLKCADMQTYMELNNMLITEQKIFDFMDSNDGTVSYAQNEKQLSMTFWMTNE